MTEIHTSNFEAVKTSMKQDKSGYVLTLNVHPDDLDETIMRDFVGSRYQVVMVRLNDDNQPMNREKEFERDPVKTAGALCSDKRFVKFIETEHGGIADNSDDAAEWLRDYLEIASRRDLRTNESATRKFWKLKEDFYLWTMIND